MLDGQNMSDGRRHTSARVAALLGLGHPDQRGAVEQEQPPEPDEREDEEPAEAAGTHERVDGAREILDERRSLPEREQVDRS